VTPDADPIFEGGPELPFGVQKHCLVRLTEFKVLLIGGSTEDEEHSDQV